LDVPVRNRDSPSLSWSLPTSPTVGRPGCIVCAERPLFCCPEGTSENSPAFQRWVGCQKVASPEGTTEVQFDTHSFGRPFGTCVRGGKYPGVKTPGYSQEVPPGQRNAATGFTPRKGTRFISNAFKRISRPRSPAMQMWNKFISLSRNDAVNSWGARSSRPLMSASRRRAGSARPK